MGNTPNEFETGLVNVSQCALQEVMSLRDPAIVGALNSLVRYVGEHSADQAASGGGGSPYFTNDCDGSRP